MLPILLTTAIFTYFIYAAHVLDLHKPALEALCKPVGDWFGEAGNPTTAVLWVMVGILTLAAWLSDEKSFLGSLQGEITGMAFTVIVIDRLNARRIEQQRKREIFEQIESSVRDIAVEAIRLAKKGRFLDEALQKVYLREKNLHSADFRGVKVQRFNVTGANLQDANFISAELQGASFRYTLLQRAKFSNSKLQEANFQGAMLQGANFRAANLKNVDMRGAHVQGADFTFAKNLESVDLKGTFVDKTLTMWPDGFDPEAAGAIYVEG